MVDGKLKVGDKVQMIGMSPVLYVNENVNVATGTGPVPCVGISMDGQYYNVDIHPSLLEMSEPAKTTQKVSPGLL